MVAISDAQSIAILIGAATTAITTLGTLLLQIRQAFKGRERDEKIAQVHDLVNGQSEKLQAAIQLGSFADGKAAGVTQERDRPQTEPRS